MAAKPETTFTASIHKKLPPLSQFHREKMANPYRSGTADVWYSANQDLWVEYKFVVLPKRPDTGITLGISALQDAWLRSRWNEGRHVWVICGCKEGGVIFDSGDWHVQLTAAKFRERLVPRDRIAAAISEHCL